MLLMAVIFVSIPVRADTGATNNDHYTRQAVGLAYTFFMIVYCRLVMLRNEWKKGYCAIAAALAALMTFSGMAFVSVQSYWVTLTKADPFFAMSLSIPLAFFLCDLVKYISDAINGQVLPAPVPGPQ